VEERRESGVVPDGVVESLISSVRRIVSARALDPTGAECFRDGWTATSAPK
jgi:hypothetical protein